MSKHPTHHDVVSGTTRVKYGDQMLTTDELVGQALKAEARIAELEEKKAQCKKALSAQLRINSAASTRHREEIVSRLDLLGVLPTDPDYARLPVEQLVCHVVGQLMAERDEGRKDRAAEADEVRRLREVIREIAAGVPGPGRIVCVDLSELEARCPWLTEGGK